MKALPSLSEIRTEKARRHLKDFIKQAWPIVEPETQYLHNWHIDCISEYLEAVTAGHIKRLLVNMPPRYMKSLIISIMWPTWEWITYPHYRYLFASYASNLSTEHSVKRRNIIQSDWYQERWGHIYQLTSDQNVKTEYMNDKSGVMVATSFGATAIGKGGNRVMIDDPHNPEEVKSDIQRNGDIAFFDGSLSTRLNNKKQDAIIVVMQRLHELDLSARCMELGYEHLCLPAECEKKTIIVMPISKQEISREPNDILWPEREGPKELEQAKIALREYGYAGQYQQHPSPVEGGMLKRFWWRYWQPKGANFPAVMVRDKDGNYLAVQPVELPDKWDELIQSWDMSFKDEKAAKSGNPDYVAGGVWGKIGADKFLLDQVCAHMDFPQTLSAVLAMTAKWPKTGAKLVEDKANGPAVIATLKHKVSGLIAVEPEGGKVARVNAVSSQIESGNVYLPHPLYMSWVDPFIEQCAAFPNGRNDDQVDQMSQALTRLERTFKWEQSRLYL